MRLDFTKMHGLGNDFMVVELPDGAPLPDGAQWRALADRHTGVGFDQALVVQPPRRPGTDAFYRVFNADGGEVEQCGNGARCVAALLFRRQAPEPRALALDSLGGLLQARSLPDGQVAIDMGIPEFEPAAVPFIAPGRHLRYAFDAAGEALEFGVVSMGNPHAVLQVGDVASAPVERIGRILQASARFPRQVNVGFMQVIDPRQVRLRVYERGVGETLACGTGACAAVVVGRSWGLLDAEVQAHVSGGVLSVHWDGPGQSVWLTGPAAQSFAGSVEVG